MDVPVVHVNPRNTSRMCPIHRAPIIYDGSRVGRCSEGGEERHRDVAATWNILTGPFGGDGSIAPSSGGTIVDGRPMRLASTAIHDPMVMARDLWARSKSLPQIAMVSSYVKLWGRVVIDIIVIVIVRTTLSPSSGISGRP
jgi:hypothetical protein